MNNLSFQGLTEDGFNRRCRDLYSDNRLVMIYKDGDAWCALIGENIQEGHAGFGNTVEDALIDLANGLKANCSDYINNEGEL